MSAVVKLDKNDNWQTSGESPLAWLRAHYRLGLPPGGAAVSWPEPEMQVEWCPVLQPRTGESPPPPALPPAWDFRPEAAPYEMSFPSQLAARPEEAASGPEGESAEGGDEARLRGVITHRALQTLALGVPFPDTASLAAALRQEGLPAAAAAALAREIQIELAACREDPFLTALLRPEIPWAASEWLLEDQPQPGVIRRGVIDLLSFDGHDWWLLDFKTSRPAVEEDWDAFIAQETERYRPQLNAYREMAARAKGLASPAAIRVGIYFTACQRVAEI